MIFAYYDFRTAYILHINGIILIHYGFYNSINITHSDFWIANVLHAVTSFNCIHFYNFDFLNIFSNSVSFAHYGCRKVFFALIIN